MHACCMSAEVIRPVQTVSLPLKFYAHCEFTAPVTMTTVLECPVCQSEFLRYSLSAVETGCLGDFIPLSFASRGLLTV